MKIAQVCNYVAPARDSMGAERIVEYVSKGLVERGHEVIMKLHPDTKESPVLGAKLVSEIPADADVIHFHGWEPHEYNRYGKPWITTIHGYELHQEWDSEFKKNIVAVSKFAAKNMGINEESYVHTCIDPTIFETDISAKKEDYFLWISGVNWFEGKGLLTTLELAKRMKFKLKVAGSGQDMYTSYIRSFCDDKISYAGSVNGKEKTDLIAKARAVILPTRLPDACPATVSETLICGTPIISSKNGALPELVNDKVGILCDIPLLKSPDYKPFFSSELARAIASVDKINRYDCYAHAFYEFHYMKAAQKFLQFYENVIKYQRTIP